MAQDISYTLKSLQYKKRSKGFASAVTILLAAILALLSYKVIEIGIIGVNVNTEKQILDTCSIVAGQSIIRTNNIQEVCNENFLNQCSIDIDQGNGRLSCIDLGLDCEENKCKRIIQVTSNYNPGRGDVSKSVEVHINEETHDVNIVDAAVIMLLDFSGSMQGNRISQLKNTVREFIGNNYNLSYSVILYNNSIITTSNINKGQNHNQSVLSIINTTAAGGGTNFINPLREALGQIQASGYEVYYILLISDGSPNEGASPSQVFVENNIRNISGDFCISSTVQNPCITLFSLGVDNANTNLLESLVGNSINQDANQYSYNVNANQTSEAFNAIIEEIMCRIGPIIADGVLYVFNELEILEENIDYIYDNQSRLLKFYDVEPFNICSEMLNNNSNITIRWNKPDLIILD